MLIINSFTKHISVHLFYKQYLWESKHYMMLNKYMLNRKFNLAKLLILHKLSFEYSSLSNLINTFDDLFHHTYMSPISHLKCFRLLSYPSFPIFTTLSILTNLSILTIFHFEKCNTSILKLVLTILLFFFF